MPNTPSTVTIGPISGNLEFTVGGVFTKDLIGALIFSADLDTANERLTLHGQDANGAAVEIIVNYGSSSAPDIYLTDVQPSGEDIVFTFSNGSTFTRSFASWFSGRQLLTFTRYVGIATSRALPQHVPVASLSTSTTMDISIPTYAGSRYPFYMQPETEDDPDHIFIGDTTGNTDINLIQSFEKLAGTVEISGVQFEVWMARELWDLDGSAKVLTIFKDGADIIGGGGGSFTPTKANIFPIVNSIFNNGLHTIVDRDLTNSELRITANIAYIGAYDSLSDDAKSRVEIGDYTLRFNRFWVVHFQAEARRNAPGEAPTHMGDTINGWRRFETPPIRIATATASWYEQGDWAETGGNLYLCGVDGNYTSTEILSSSNWRNVTSGMGGGVTTAQLTAAINAHTAIATAHHTAPPRVWLLNAPPAAQSGAVGDWAIQFNPAPPSHTILVYEKTDQVTWTERFTHAISQNRFIPDGGTIGQVLKKIGSGDYQTGWRDDEGITADEKHNIGEIPGLLERTADLSIVTVPTWAANGNAAVSFALVADLQSLGNPTYRTADANYSQYGDDDRFAVLRIPNSGFDHRNYRFVYTEGADTYEFDVSSFQRVAATATHDFYGRATRPPTGTGSIQLQVHTSTTTTHFRGETEAVRAGVTTTDFDNIPTTATSVQAALDWIDDNLGTGGTGTVVTANPTGTDGDELERIGIAGTNYWTKVGAHLLPSGAAVYDETANTLSISVTGGFSPERADAVLFILPDTLSSSTDALNLVVTYTLEGGGTRNHPLINFDRTPVNAAELVPGAVLEAFRLFLDGSDSWVLIEPTDLLQTEVESATSTRFGLVSGQRLSQAVTAHLPDLVTQTAAEAGTATDEQMWSALRVAQAIAALAPGGQADRDYDNLTNKPILRGTIQTVTPTADNANALLWDTTVKRLYRNVRTPGHGASADWTDLNTTSLREAVGTGGEFLNFRGTVPNSHALPDSPTHEDVYYVRASDSFYRYSTNVWTYLVVSKHVAGFFTTEAQAEHALGDVVGSGNGNGWIAAFDSQGVLHDQAFPMVSSNYTAPTGDNFAWVDYLSGVIAQIQAVAARIPESGEAFGDVFAETSALATASIPADRFLNTAQGGTWTLTDAPDGVEVQTVAAADIGTRTQDRPDSGNASVLRFPMVPPDDGVIGLMVEAVVDGTVVSRVPLVWGPGSSSFVAGSADTRRNRVSTQLHTSATQYVTVIWNIPQYITGTNADGLKSALLIGWSTATQPDDTTVRVRLLIARGPKGADATLPQNVTQAEAEAGTETDIRMWSPHRVSQAIAALGATLPDTVSQTEAEAGTATTTRLWTAQRVAQAIAALATGAGGVSQADFDAHTGNTTAHHTPTVLPLVVPQTEAVAGTNTTTRLWSALRVAQAIAALAGATLHTGTGQPQAATGADEDLYLRFEASAIAIWTKASGAWTQTHRLSLSGVTEAELETWWEDFDVTLSGSSAGLQWQGDTDDGTTRSATITPQNLGDILTHLSGSDGQFLSRSGSAVAWANALTSVAHDDTLTGNGTSSSQLGVSVHDVIESLHERIRHFGSGTNTSTKGASVGHIYTTGPYHTSIWRVIANIDAPNTGITCVCRLYRLNDNNTIAAHIGNSESRSLSTDGNHYFDFHEDNEIPANSRIAVLISRTDADHDSAVFLKVATESNDSPEESYDDASVDFNRQGWGEYENREPPNGESTETHNTTLPADVYGDLSIQYTRTFNHGQLVGNGNVNADHISSGTAADGHVLTADGSGGAAWEAPTGGGTTVWQGTWSAGTYTAGQVVEHGNGVLWMASATTTDTPMFGSTNDWIAIAPASAWRGDYVTNGYYEIGQMVESGGDVYLKTDINGNQPLTDARWIRVSAVDWAQQDNTDRIPQNKMFANTTISINVDQSSGRYRINNGQANGSTTNVLLPIWTGTQAAYDALTPAANVLYFTT